ncbi:divisome-associated lipoprotein YraP [Endozoicomonas sp. G2_1]|uniref:division/outer membrane stress-associated lipid-binding lipoprotein n=1 Tax=Endozoicomonas sp. G2_1 TaxID=2821091 RepID=UPI001ADB477E|nr:division/outer membrane stress-associated lipid-binding lipoprotein [Endozoicomonas sp. G2_1]MBO9489571.1 divisome-associated lipoprotein YraP [Endozoicomonas sp. G2_1]
MNSYALTKLSLKKLAIISATVAILQGCVGVAAVGVAGGISAANDERSIGAQIDDQTIEISAYAKLAEQEGLSKQTRVQVTSINGSLLVVGQAPNDYLRDSVLKTLNQVKGVKRIHNQLRIGNKTSLATRSHDTWLTSKVKTALFADDNVRGNNIKVVTENGEVFLMGLVSQAEANKAVDIARNVSGVNRVFKAFEYQ